MQRAKLFVRARELGSVLLVVMGLLSEAWPAVAENILYRFTGGYDGGIPYSSLVFDAAGNLYGTTRYGGKNIVFGTVFQLTPRGNGKWRERVIYSFKGNKDGEDPTAGVVFDKAGNLYGTAGAGVYGYGTVYKLSPKNGKWIKSTLYDFKGSSYSDGQYPSAGVILDKAGNLYGTTVLGGPASQTCPAGCGTVFKLTRVKNHWAETLLHKFTGQNGDGAGVWAGLTFDQAGNLFGTTAEGGVSGYGMVYELTAGKGRWKETVLHGFAGGSDGASPHGGVIFDSLGNLYGTTYAAGPNIWGTVFELTPSTSGWAESVLYGFGYSDGASPYFGSLVFDQAGNLYGTTLQGGRNAFGVVFGLTANNGQWSENILYSFTGKGNKDGWEPVNGLVSDAAGNLYGTTSGGGYGPCLTGLGCGVIFEISH